MEGAGRGASVPDAELVLKPKILLVEIDLANHLFFLIFSYLDSVGFRLSTTAIIVYAPARRLLYWRVDYSKV